MDLLYMMYHRGLEIPTRVGNFNIFRLESLGIVHNLQHCGLFIPIPPFRLRGFKSVHLNASQTPILTRYFSPWWAKKLKFSKNMLKDVLVPRVWYT